MLITGLLTKMITEYDTPIQYFLNFESEFIAVNQLIGQNIKITFNHYQCLHCGKEKEIFAMGFCKNCYFTYAGAGESILKPELSKAHLGIADRDLDFEMKLQLQPHIVYLANSGGIKVGITRKTQIPTRWIDQGAEEIIKLAEVENRYQSGLIEVAVKQHISDKTNYRKMLSGPTQKVDLIEIKNQIETFVPQEMKNFILQDNSITKIQYPIVHYPTKINSINLKKHPAFEGKLTGIKGQYLLFENNLVFNVRNHEGFVVDIEI